MVGLNDSAVIETTGKIMVMAIILLFLVVIFVLFLHLYAKWFLWRTEEPPLPPPQQRGLRRVRFTFTPVDDPLHSALDPSVLGSLPMVILGSDEFKGGLDCAICLSEVEQGEKARLLPQCNHGFHIDCIDMWFLSNSTCPLCRNSVAPLSPIPGFYNSNDLEENNQSSEEISDSQFSVEPPSFPTNVLFQADRTQVGASVCGRGSGSDLEQGTSTQSVSSSLPSSSSLSASSSYSSSEVGPMPEVILVMEDAMQMSGSFEEEENKSPVPMPRLLVEEKGVLSSSSLDV
ncbi:hypothetical protein K2173_024657 [Erythroxylum novogranatense]|uniref:RING-type E3 ubiquitin transferase n=1 Tax=Erythroxylum novogranatense TaxID=1862640 RepID=A0AAV8SVQ4_9ROSI|nr:hypothetical protein K2173_024657 [Erythroxylum novogranatense]